MAEEKKLYQLVAISNGLETVIELKNDNKKNRGTLEYIDSGTTYFKDRNHLAWYLCQNGKINNINSDFAIRYNNNGERKYVSVVYDDAELRAIAKGNKTIEYACYFLIKIEVALTDPGFLEFIMSKNKRTGSRYKNGNRINQRLMNLMIEYYSAYVKTHNIDANKGDIRHDILNQLYQYKQLRVLRDFYLEYEKQKNIVPPTSTTKIK